MYLPITFNGLRTLITFITILIVTADLIFLNLRAFNLTINKKRFKAVTNLMIIVFAITFLVSLYLEVMV